LFPHHNIKLFLEVDDEDEVDDEVQQLDEDEVDDDEMVDLYGQQ
jgi:hypothetical protein